MTTAVSPQVLDLLTSYLTSMYPNYSNILIPIAQWLTGLGGVGVIIGGIVSYIGFQRYGGIIIILSILGGIVSYGTFLYTAQQTGLFNQPVQQILTVFPNLGLGFVATVLSIIAYIKSR